MPLAAISPVNAVAATGTSTSRPSAPARAAAELPDAPKPVTPANAAVHIMQVPTSRLVEAFASLQRAMGQQRNADEAPPPTAPDTTTAAHLFPEPAPAPIVDVQA